MSQNCVVNVSQWLSQKSSIHSFIQSNPKLSKAENESFINTSFTNLRSMKS